MEQAKTIKQPFTKLADESENIIKEQIFDMNIKEQVIDIKDLKALIEAQAEKIAQLEKRVLPTQINTINTKAPIYRISSINGRIISSVFNDKKTQIDDRGKAYVVQEFVVSYFDVKSPERMSMTVFREMVQRIDTELVRTIQSDTINPITGATEIEAFELKVIHPRTGEEKNYIISKQFVNI